MLEVSWCFEPSQNAQSLLVLHNDATSVCVFDTEINSQTLLAKSLSMTPDHTRIRDP